MLDRSTPPEIKDEIKFGLPKIEKSKITDKFNTYFVEKNSLPIVVLNFVLHRGSILDPENKHGLATLVGLTIDEGANGYNALEIDSMLESLGSELNISVDHDYIYFSLLSLTKNFERTLEITSWVLQKPNFSQADFEREKEKHLSKIIKAKDDPSFLADWTFSYFLNQSNPYKFPNIGISTNIENISLNDIKDFYNRYFTPENFSLIGVGNLTNDEFTNLVEKYFGNWLGKSSNEVKIDLSKNANKKIFLVDKPEAKQSEIKIGNFATNRKAPDYFAKRIVNSVLGGQFSSRLNRNLREEKGITYGVHTNFNYNLNLGYFEASTSVETKHTLLALSEFSKELNFIREKITDVEIAFAKSYLKKIFPLQFETFSQLASNFTTQLIYNLPNDYFEKFIPNLEAVTEEEILSAAKNNILPDEQLTVIVGDAKVLEKDLSNFAESEQAEIQVLSVNDLEI